MILFLGTKLGKATYKNMKAVNCVYCHKIGTLQLVSVPTYLHLFWIPLLKISTKIQASCNHCRKTYMQEEFTMAMKKAQNMS